MQIRLPAEWEKQSSIMVVFPTNHKDWQHSLKEIQKSYIEFINAIIKFQKCIVVCDKPDILKNHLITTDNIEIYNIKTDDTWIRDFGPIDVYINGELKSYNFKFNAWGNKFQSSLDNNFNKYLCKKNLIDIDFILEGGSIESNGDGVMLSTSKCIFNANRNSTYKPKDIEEKLATTFGLKKLIILKYGHLIGDDTDAHIDTLARFIDKETIAYAKCTDKNDIHFNELLKMEDELKKTGFKLVPLPLPSPIYFNNRRLPATYLNFVFINDAIIVPTYNDKNDKKVLEILKKKIKNRKVIGVNSKVFIRENGSLHCSSINNFMLCVS